MVRTFGYKCLKIVDGLLCRNLPADGVEIQWSCFTYYVNDMSCGGSETEISR